MPFNIYKIHPVYGLEIWNFNLKNVHDYYDFMQTLWDPIMYVHTECTSL